jgi:hypothetical protein
MSPKAALSKSRFALVLALGLLVVAGGAAQAPSATGAANVRLLVKFKAATPSGAADKLVAAVGAQPAGVVRGLGVRVVTVPSARAAAALGALKRSASVAYAERDLVLAPQDQLPSDPSFPTGSFAIAGGAWGWTKTHTTQAWDVTKGSPSVVVAVLDTGLKTQGLSDFNGQVVSGWNVLNGTTDTGSNAGNHGTYVAGVVGLGYGNAAGNVGYCPGCRVMPVQVGTDSGAYVSDMASGITWAADHGARVENLSWAGATASATLDNAVSYARSKNVVVVAAAGNSNCDCTNYPAASPGVIGVAGTDSADNKQGDSNFGSWVAVAAPESNMTAWPTLNGAPGYAQVGGTSLASPVVAALAGLLFSANSSLTAAQVEQALEASAVPVGFTVKYGRVDALAALNYLGIGDPQASAAPSNTAAPQILVETNGDYNSVPLSGAPQVGQVLLRAQGSWVGSAPLGVSSVQWQRCDGTGASCTVAVTASKYTIQSTDAGSTFRLAVTVKNGLGSATAFSPLSAPVGTATAAAPANTALPVVSGTAQTGQTLTASTGTWSGSPTGYAYQWQRCTTSCAAISGATAPSYAVQSGDGGSTLRVAVTATNSGGSATATSAATAVVAAPPSTTKTQTFSASLTPKTTSQSFTVTAGAGASNAQLSFTKCPSLTLTITSGGATVATLTGPSVVTLAPTLAAGTYTYTVSGGRCSFTLTVTTAGP